MDIKNEYSKNKGFFLSLYDVESEELKNMKYEKYLKKTLELALKGCLDSQFDLAQHYDKGGFFGEINPHFNNFKRFYWYVKSALNGYGDSYNNLADLIERGDGCKKNLSKALLYYKRAKELGCELGKVNYEIMLKDMGKGGIYYNKMNQI